MIQDTSYNNWFSSIPPKVIVLILRHLDRTSIRALSVACNDSLHEVKIALNILDSLRCEWGMSKMYLDGNAIKNLDFVEKLEKARFLFDIIIVTLDSELELCENVFDRVQPNEVHVRLDIGHSGLCFLRNPGPRLHRLEIASHDDEYPLLTGTMLSPIYHLSKLELQSLTVSDDLADMLTEFRSLESLAIYCCKIQSAKTFDRICHFAAESNSLKHLDIDFQETDVIVNSKSAACLSKAIFKQNLINLTIDSTNLITFTDFDSLMTYHKPDISISLKYLRFLSAFTSDENSSNKLTCFLNAILQPKLEALMIENLKFGTLNLSEAVNLKQMSIPYSSEFHARFIIAAMKKRIKYLKLTGDLPPFEAISYLDANIACLHGNLTVERRNDYKESEYNLNKIVIDHYGEDHITGKGRANELALYFKEFFKGKDCVFIGWENDNNVSFDILDMLSLTIAQLQSSYIKILAHNFSHNPILMKSVLVNPAVTKIGLYVDHCYLRSSVSWKLFLEWLAKGNKELVILNTNFEYTWMANFLDDYSDLDGDKSNPSIIRLIACQVSNRLESILSSSSWLRLEIED